MVVWWFGISRERFHIDLLQGTEATAAAVVAMAVVDTVGEATAAVTTVAVWRLRTMRAKMRRYEKTVIHLLT